jgi:hypothetical protein
MGFHILLKDLGHTKLLIINKYKREKILSLQKRVSSPVPNDE